MAKAKVKPAAKAKETKVSEPTEKKVVRRRRGPAGFLIPRTLEDARAMGLAHDVSDEVSSYLAKIEPAKSSLSAAVEVGQLWHLGEVHGDKVYACYRNDQNGCDWVEVPVDNIPKRKPA